ncbi:hypothetical protein ASE21_19280 [Flavobacterium sp. Root901]|uniref:hypothetical protein n=1 Tax=Flavobacterium sp. Root901 TaxID=1736605 RepID=UPI00070CFF9A|nr:hypothetical protein [Flavobacterium sp. Root901]KRD06315.1 hypothetical protein ASE21_19280 [Flavobacterium sp. Root901]
MSTNHNRIRVADLETNEPNKILITNEKGELEFNDVSELQTEKYNALDCTTEGKALDARQGKVLKDMINNISTSPPSLVNDLTTGGTAKALTAEMGKTLENTKLTASIATDPETQIITAVEEDKKVISRLKLFNWWNWIKKQPLKWSNTITINQGNSTNPPLIIPTGVLTTTPVVGAIETDTTSIYYTSYDGTRKNLSDKAIFSNTTLSINNFGQGFIGLQEFITPVVTNSRLFNNGAKQFDSYSIFSNIILSKWNSNVTSAKMELQINISNSVSPNSWFTISQFEANRSDLTAGLPLNIVLSSDLNVQAINDKYVFFSGSNLNFVKSDTLSGRTNNLSIDNQTPLKTDMLVSLRIKSSLSFSNTTQYQDFYGSIPLFQMTKK